MTAGPARALPCDGDTTAPISAETFRADFTETLVVRTGAAGTSAPDIDGETVVWSDTRTGTPDVYAWSPDAGARLIFGGQSAQRDPVLDGEYVAYVTTLYGGPVAWLNDLSAGNVGWRLSPGAGDEVDIDGDIVVWTDMRDGPEAADIWAYDVKTGATFPVCTAEGPQTSPAVSDGVVVWTDDRPGRAAYSMPHTDIFGKDLATGREFPVCTAPGDQRDPDIFGGVIVWEDARPSAAVTDIYGILPWRSDPSTPVLICPARGAQSAPSVWGSWVVWEDRREPDDADIRGFDLMTGLPFTVCDATGDQTTPTVGNQRVAWVDARGGTTALAIYQATGTPADGDDTPPITAPVTGWSTIQLLTAALEGAEDAATLRLSFDGSTWSAWQPFEPFMTVDLPGGDGKKTLYLQTATADGLESDPVIVTVTLDTHGPRTFAPYPASAVKGQGAALQYRVKDALSPKANVTVRITRGGRLVKLLRLGTKPTGRLLRTTFTCRLPKGAYRFSVRATDVAGNRQRTVGSNRFTVI